MTQTMTAEQIVKARQLLAKEVNDRKVYADALEAVNALEGLAETEKELKASVERLSAERDTLDADCDAAAGRLKEIEAEGANMKLAAQNEADQIKADARATAHNIVDAAGKEAKKVKAGLADVEALLEAKKKELDEVNATIDRARKTLDGFKAKVDSVLGASVDKEV